MSKSVIDVEEALDKFKSYLFDELEYMEAVNISPVEKGEFMWPTVQAIDLVSDFISDYPQYDEDEIEAHLNTCAMDIGALVDKKIWQDSEKDYEDDKINENI